MQIEKEYEIEKRKYIRKQKISRAVNIALGLLMFTAAMLRIVMMWGEKI